MIAGLLDHLWQSTLFAGVIALLVPLLRTNRAAIRYALWFTASVKFLLPFSLLARVGAALPAGGSGDECDLAAELSRHALRCASLTSPPPTMRR